MAERPQPNRWRCLTAGCNPVLVGEAAASAHRDDLSHRVAKWPVRSKAGKRKAKARNRSGYYDRYNVGSKSAVARGLVPEPRAHVEDDHIFSTEALGQW